MTGGGLTSDLNEVVLGLKINSCKIGGIEFKNAVTQLDYYEDIFSNFVSGSLMLSASSSFQDELRWSGNEYIDLEISKPGIEELESSGKVYPLKARLRIFNIQARKLGNDGNENYYITFCSPPLMISEQTRISKSYKDKRIDEIIKDIANEYLGIDINIKKTFGKRDIVIPKLKPFEAINWLCTQAISEELPSPLESGAEYLFWANRDGYYCWSILNIYNSLPAMIYRNPLSAVAFGQGRGTTSGYWYGTKNIEQSFDATKWDPYEHIISLEVQNSYDTAESSQRGMYGTPMLSIDYIRRKHEIANFNYNDYWDYLHGNIVKFKQEEYNDLKPFDAPNVKEEIERTLKYKEMESTLKMYPSTTTQQESEYLQLIGAYDYPNYVETFVPYRYAQLGLVSYQRLKISVPGDPFIAVGYVVKVNFPRTNKSIKETGEKEDRTLSGWYLVAAVRHTLNQENQFMTVLELLKEAKHRPTM